MTETTQARDRIPYNEKDVVPVAECAEACGMGYNYTKELAKKAGAWIECGRRRLIDRRKFEDFLKQMAQPPAVR